jgi:tetratricopeptide (TPR) repeat protein
VILLNGTLMAQNAESIKLFNKGQQLFLQGKPKEAIEMLNKSIAADSTNANAWVRRGFIKGTMEDFEGEMEDYSYVIKHIPNHVWAYISRGAALNKLNRFDEAIADLEKAILLDPTIPESYNNEGFSYKGKNDVTKACECWTKSLKMGNSEASIILKNNHCK